jgi:putative aldouronate transport system permease protein
VILATGRLDSTTEYDPTVGNISQSIKMATIVVSTIPIIMVYPFLQKHFAKGALVGSVKG